MPPTNYKNSGMQDHDENLKQLLRKREE
jgi:hypothetical protein